MVVSTTDGFVAWISFSVSFGCFAAGVAAALSSKFLSEEDAGMLRGCATEWKSVVTAAVTDVLSGADETIAARLASLCLCRACERRCVALVRAIDSNQSVVA